MKRFLQNMLMGAGSIISFFPQTAPPTMPKLYKPAASVHDALMSDWNKVANDFTRTVQREQTKIKRT